MTGLRVRILLIVLVALVPALGVTVFQGFRERAREQDVARRLAAEVARHIAHTEHDVIESARQLLVVLSRVPDVAPEHAVACRAVFRSLIDDFRLLSNLVAVRPDGEVFCSAVPVPEGVTLAGRPTIEQALRTRRFAVGNYVLGAITGRPALPVTYPVLDSSGRVRAILAATVHGSALGQLSQLASLPAGAALMLVDSRGGVVSRYPESSTSPGTWLDASTFEVIKRDREGVAALPGIADADRIAVFAAVPSVDTPAPLHVILVVPRTAVFGDADVALWRHFFGFAVAGGLALVIAWRFARRSVVQPIEAIAATALRLGRGDLTARARVGDAPGSIGLLATAFDEMADALERDARDLAEAEVRYRALVEQSLVGVYVVRADRMVYLNEACAKMFGYRASEAIGLGLDRFIHPDDRSLVFGNIAVRLGGETDSHRYTFRGLRRDDGVVHCEVFGRRVVYQGEPAILGALMDVTERDRTETELRRLNRALKTLIGCNQLLVRSTDERELVGGICRLAVGVGGYRIACVARARPDGRPGQTIATAASAEGEEPRTVEIAESEPLEPAVRAMATGQPVIVRNLGAEALLGRCCGDALDRGCRSVIALPMITGERVLGALTIWAAETDVFDRDEVVLLSELAEDLAFGIASLDARAERLRAEEELRRQRDARYQSDKLASMGQLLAGVAHELNNPLAVVGGRATLLQQRLRDTPLAPQTDKLVDAAARCARIVRNFLAIARQHPPERTDVDVNRVVREAVELLAYQLRVDDVDVRFELAPDLPIIAADGHQLSQVVLNLVTNAHHAMRAGACRRLTVSTEHQEASGFVVLRVSDTGPGIATEIQERIFEPFFTTKPAGEGTGLGLSLCKGIVEGHGGVLSVQSEAGRGATFSVELPAHVAPRRPHPVLDAGSRAAPAGPRKVLVVDDEADVRELLVESLSMDGHDVDTAADGVHALEQLGTARYDVILADVRMPYMDGPTLHRHIVTRHPDVAGRVVFFTGDALTAEADEWLQRDGLVCLSKPFDLDVVRRVVRELGANGSAALKPARHVGDVP